MKNKNLHVLLVDDDDLFLLLHQRILKRCGFSGEVVCVKDGKAALEYLQNHRQSADHWLVFLDINMPVLDGWGFLEAVQQESFAASVAVVMATSSVDEADRKRAQKYHLVLDYLEKPLAVAACQRILDLPEGGWKIGRLRAEVSADPEGMGMR